MNRRLLLLPLLMIPLAALPYILGYQVEQRYHELNRSLADSGVSAKLQHYDRGWLHADTLSHYRLVLPSDSGQPSESPQTLEFLVSSRITHGPWLSGAGRFGLAHVESRVRMLPESGLDPDDPAPVKTHIHLDGHGEMEISFDPLSYSAAGAYPDISFAGMEGLIRFDPDYTAVSVALEMPGLLIGDKAGDFISIDEVELQSESWKLASGLLLGRGHLKLGSMTVRNRLQQQEFSLESLSMAFDSQEQAVGVSADASYRFERVQLDSESYGPGVLNMSLERLPSPVLSEMQQQLEEISENRLDPVQQQIAMMSVLMSSAPGILENDPRFQISDLSLSTPQGEIKGRLSVQTNQLAWADISNPVRLLEALLVSGRLSIPAAYLEALLSLDIHRKLVFIEQQQSGTAVTESRLLELEQQAKSTAVGQLQALTDQGLLILSGENYRAEIELADGLLSINGKSFPFPR